jgi:hypothetical protein
MKQANKCIAICSCTCVLGTLRGTQTSRQSTNLPWPESLSEEIPCRLLLATFGLCPPSFLSWLFVKEHAQPPGTLSKCYFE